jgi:hypothetical protein
MDKEQELKVGDVLVCIKNDGFIEVGEEYEITEELPSGFIINFKFHITKRVFNKYFKLKTEIKMEKQIKMSLETARELYQFECLKENSTCTPTAKWLLENFTKEELEGKKGFTWEESFNGGGFYIKEANAKLGQVTNYVPSEGCSAINVFKTKEDAESALAYAQLTHICAKYNEGKFYNRENYFTIINIGNRLSCDTTTETPILYFYKSEDMITSLDVNRELWEKYCKIKK